MQSEGLPAFAVVARLAAEGADATTIATEAVAAWREVHGVLAAIIGEPGVAAVFRRSLYLIRAEHAWLASVHESTTGADLMEPLHAALSKQTSSRAVSGNDALLRAFIDLLSNLIGSGLTQRLLISAPTGRSDAVQERT